jgi:hypothetical protein
MASRPRREVYIAAEDFDETHPAVLVLIDRTESGEMRMGLPHAGRPMQTSSEWLDGLRRQLGM